MEQKIRESTQAFKAPIADLISKVRKQEQVLKEQSNKMQQLKISP